MTKKLAKAEKKARLIARLAERETGEEIDWKDIERQVRQLSRAGNDGVRLQAEPEQILAEAQRLARIYGKAGKPLPDTLAALV